ncbi:hypothetical protein ABTF44_22485, partial [Acinetobacter baumannii]
KKPLEQFLFPESSSSNNEEIDIDRIQFNISENVSNNVDITVASITEMAIEQDQVMQTEVAKQRTDDQPFFTELTGMAKQ